MTVSIIYAARVAVVNKLAQEQLSVLGINITCLDFSFTREKNIVLKKLCLSSPKADIKILDTKLAWQYSNIFQITDIHVQQAKIIGSSPLFPNISETTDNNANSENNTNELLSSIVSPYIAQIAQLSIPMRINVDELLYLPFTAARQSNTARQQQAFPYSAKVSAINNDITLSLKKADNEAFFSVTLTKSSNEKQSPDDFTINLHSKLTPLKHFVSSHQLPITTELQHLLNTNEISGEINTAIFYQNNMLNMQSEIANLVITAKHGISKSGPFKLSGTLNFQSQLPLSANDKIKVTFNKNNKISLDYSQPHLVSVLEESAISPALIAILNDNPVTNLTATFANNSILSLHENIVDLSAIEVSANGAEREHLAALNKVSFSLADSSANISKQAFNHLAIEHFVIDSDVKLADIAAYTTSPVTVHLEGALQKSAQKIALNLKSNSSVTTTNIALTKTKGKQKHKDRKESNSKTKGNSKAKTLVSLKALSATLEGNLQVVNNNIHSMNLRTYSQASQVNVPKTLQVKSFELISDIKGDLDNIKVNATTKADGVNLGSIIISGPVLTPNVHVAANDIQLTDLLSLNIQLPAKIELIDGLLDYSISGQITDFSNIENTPLSASIAVTSLSGDIDGIWLQELNWQQHFTVLAGKVTTTPSTKENLTVELIETATPISKLSINTHWTFNKSFAFSANKLKADVLGGSFSIPKIQWPFEHGHSVNVQLKSIDLEQVLALDKKQGIVVTGDISGELPVTFDGEKYIIENGELHNISNGLIQVIDNPAVNELKANNSQLQLAFDALQNLHYHQLSSDVSMADDGYMLLETVIKGRNPDIDNDVNLNLNLSYDLLGLLESLSITQRFEDSIIKGLQKNKE